jgi:hypothetical protein
MARKKPHIGSSFESRLEDAGIREEVTVVAIKAVIARQLASEMKKKENHQAADGRTDEDQSRASRSLAGPRQRRCDDREPAARCENRWPRVAAAVGVTS